MSFASVPAVVMASIASVVGLFSLVLYLRLRRGRVLLSFAVLCLAVAVYDALCAGLYSATSVADGVIWQRLQGLALLAGAIALLFFIGDFADQRRHWASRVLAAAYLLSFVVGAVRPDLLWTDEPHVKQVRLPFGWEVTYHEGASGPLNAALGLLLVLLVVHVMVVAVRYAARHPGGRGRALVASTAVFLVGVGNDSLVAQGVYPFVYTIEYAFLALVGLMGWTLADELVRALATERALAETEERYRQLVEASPSGILLVEPGGRIVFANPAAVTILGAAVVDDLVGRRVHELVPEERHQRLERLLEAALAGSGPLVTTEQEMVRVDGTPVQVAVAGVGVEREGQRVVLAVGTDITARKRAEADRARLEAQLLHAQKLEAVGQLAGGVAHGFNNLLQALTSRVETLEAHLDDPARLRAGLREVKERVWHGARLTRQLLLFARRESACRERLEVARVVRETADLSRGLLPEHVDLVVELAGGPLPIVGDRSQLEQVVMNLVVNASAAISDRGRVTVRAGPAGDGRVLLEVADTGAGVDEEIRDRVFEPFFTTRPRGEGSGLGLAVVHGIVAAHGGEVTLESEVGRGTVVRVLLPAAEEGVGAGEAVASGGGPAGPPEGRGERILVVEDEGDTRSALCAILEALGYRASGAGDAGEARRLVAQQPFDLVLADVVLPDGRGNDLARELVAAQPGLVVLLMSGYAPDWALRQDVADGAVAFLQKPFDMATLAERVRAELVGRPGAARD